MFLKSTKWTFLLSMLLIAYLAVVLPLSASSERKSKYRRYRIEISDPQQSHFVTARTIKAELDLDTLIQNGTRGTINLYELSKRVSAIPEIESVEVTESANGDLVLSLTPLMPVARVFENGRSIYINSKGKKVTADMKYHIDVPVVVSRLSSNSERTVLDMLPMLRYIKQHPEIDALVSDITLERNGDMVIQPVIRGHVINFGDTADVADKFTRLLTFYRKVSAVKGWDYYDTIAVKWRGQVVAKRNLNKFARPTLPEEEAEFEFVDDDETMDSGLPDSLRYDPATAKKAKAYTGKDAGEKGVKSQAKNSRPNQDVKSEASKKNKDSSKTKA